MSQQFKRDTPLLSGHKVEPVVGDEAVQYGELWKGYTNGVIRMQPGGTLMTAPFVNFHDRIMNFKFHSDDVVMMTYPKCGTTWMQEIIWTMRNNPDLENPMAAAPVNLRVPFMELDTILVTDATPPPPPEHPLMQTFKKMCPKGNPADGVFIQIAENTPQPRCVKTHLPFSLLPKDMLDKSKVVYVMRNPKDVAVSYFHHCRLMRNQDFRGTLDQFVDSFIAGDLLYGHYDKHLKEVFALKSHKNLIIVQYEELKANPLQEIKRLDKFLGTNLNEEQLAKVVHYTSFDEMKKRDNLLGPSEENAKNGIFNADVLKKDGGFFRKGQAGNWKEKLSPESGAKIDAWVEEKFKESDIKFRFS